MALPSLYIAFVRILQLFRLVRHDNEDLAVEVVMLRHEIAVLGRQVARPALRSTDRAVLAGLSPLLDRRRRQRFFVQPESMFRWHRDLVRRRLTQPHGPGSRSIPADTVAIIRRFAPENPGDTQASSVLACDFFSVDTVLLKRLYVLFFIELDPRRVYVTGVTANPIGAWVVQQARNLSMVLVEWVHPVRFLIRDRDTKFTAGLDDVFRSEGVWIIRTPVRAPRASAFAGRWVSSHPTRWTSHCSLAIRSRHNYDDEIRYLGLIHEYQLVS
jgi:hypothetical protein